jgi:hypothetical protein
VRERWGGGLRERAVGASERYTLHVWYTVYTTRMVHSVYIHYTYGAQLQVPSTTRAV